MSLNTLIMMAREDAAVADIEAPATTTEDALEAVEAQEAQEAMNVAETEIEGSDQAEALAEEIQEEVNANNEVIESEVEPTDVQVAVAEERFKAFAKSACLSGKLVTENFTFLPGAKMNSFSLESYSYTSKSNKDKLIETTMAMESIVQNLKDVAKNAWKAIVEFFTNLYKKIKGFFSKKKEIAEAAETAAKEVEAQPEVAEVLKEEKIDVKAAPKKDGEDASKKLYAALYKLINGFEQGYTTKHGAPKEVTSLSDVITLAPGYIDYAIKVAKKLDEAPKANLDFYATLMPTIAGAGLAATREAAGKEISARFAKGFGSEFTSVQSMTNQIPKLAALSKSFEEKYVKNFSPLLEKLTNALKQNAGNNGHAEDDKSAMLKAYKEFKNVVKGLENVSDALTAILAFYKQEVEKAKAKAGKKEAKK